MVGSTARSGQRNLGDYFAPSFDRWGCILRMRLRLRSATPVCRLPRADLPQTLNIMLDVCYRLSTCEQALQNQIDQSRISLIYTECASIPSSVKHKLKVLEYVRPGQPAYERDPTIERDSTIVIPLLDSPIL